MSDDRSRPPGPPPQALVPFAPSPLGLPAAGRDVRDALEEALLALWNGLESPESRRGYRDDWQRWAGWLAGQQMHPLAVAPLQVQRYLADLYNRGKAKSTRARALSVIRQTYGALVVAGLLPANPAREVKNIKVASEPRTPWLADTELRQLLVRPATSAPWVQHRDWLICATLTGTGLRRSEVARLRRDRLVPAEGGLAARVRAKGGKDAFIALPGWLSTEIDAWCRAQAITGPIFPSHPGGTTAIGPTTVRNAVKRAAERAGIDLSRSTPHALRRSFATITGQRGVSLRDRQTAMMHSNQATTERYDKAATLPKAAPGEVLRDLAGPAHAPTDLTTTDLDRIFAVGHVSGEREPLYVKLLRHELRSATARIDPVVLPPSRLPPEDFAGKSYEHKKLCAQAATWLEDQKLRWAVDDLDYVGGTADVRAVGIELYVECGYAQASKVLDALVANQEVLICPYGADGRAFLFRPVAGCVTSGSVRSGLPKHWRRCLTT
jgi:integrase/recombinase XerD